jgi:hypothetical protein
MNYPLALIVEGDHIGMGDSVSHGHRSNQKVVRAGDVIVRKKKPRAG